MSSNLLSLPLELREEIYHLVLLNHQRSFSPYPEVPDAVLPTFHILGCRELGPGLLLVSSQVRIEAQQVLFSRFIIYCEMISNLGDLEELLSRFSPIARSMLAYLSLSMFVKIDSEDSSTCRRSSIDGLFAVLRAALPNLKTLTVPSLDMKIKEGRKTARALEISAGIVAQEFSPLSDLNTLSVYIESRDPPKPLVLGWATIARTISEEDQASILLAYKVQRRLQGLGAKVEVISEVKELSDEWHSKCEERWENGIFNDGWHARHRRDRELNIETKSDMPSHVAGG